MHTINPLLQLMRLQEGSMTPLAYTMKRPKVHACHMGTKADGHKALREIRMRLQSWSHVYHFNLSSPEMCARQP